MNKIDGSKKRFLDEEQITSNKKREISPGIRTLISAANRLQDNSYSNGLNLLSLAATGSLVNFPTNTTSLTPKSRLTELEKKIDDVASKIDEILSNIKEIERLSSQPHPQSPSSEVSTEVHILEIMSFEGYRPPRLPTPSNKSKS